MAPKHHTLDIYDVRLHLATTGRDWGTLRRTIIPLGSKPTALGHSDFLAFTPTEGGPPQRHYVIWIDTATIGGSTPDLIDTIAHEAAHVATDIMDWTGAPIAPVSEPHAYLTGWLTRWIWEGCHA